MSDTDDGFDEEAVRRELREKYEDDDRAETERMSELLLQGATMTNQHCDDCGSPIFRYDGQSFCPNCQHAAQQAAHGDQGQQPPRTDSSGQPEQSEQRQPPQQSQPTANASDAESTGSADAGYVADVDQSAVADAAATGDRGRQPSGAAGQPDAGRQPSEAADALESSIAALARCAAGSDDPRTAREYLEAAREAAEALAALRRNA